MPLNLSGSLQTTNEQPGLFKICTLAPHTIAYVRASVVGRQVGGSAGGLDQGGHAFMDQTFAHRDSGAPLEKINYQSFYFDDAVWDTDFVMQGDDLFLRLTGAMNQTINWVFELVCLVL